MEVKLTVTNGQAKGRVIPLPGTVFLIGRGKQCHLRPHCRLVSKLHCAIAVWAGKVAVRDLKSTNGTFVNGEAVHGEISMHDGDVLRVGTLEFKVTIQLSPEEKLAVPVVHESEVRWLVDSDQDVTALKSPQTLLDATLLAAEHPSASSSEGALSAGDLLRDYLRQRKRSRP
jgi:pSer/pThr/pTyr-binding forkhead associated (FHA) protein